MSDIPLITEIHYSQRELDLYYPERDDVYKEKLSTSGALAAAGILVCVLIVPSLASYLFWAAIISWFGGMGLLFAALYMRESINIDINRVVAERQRREKQIPRECAESSRG